MRRFRAGSTSWAERSSGHEVICCQSAGLSCECRHSILHTWSIKHCQKILLASAAEWFMCPTNIKHTLSLTPRKDDRESQSGEVDADHLRCVSWGWTWATEMLTPMLSSHKWLSLYMSFNFVILAQICPFSPLHLQSRHISQCWRLQC